MNEAEYRTWFRPSPWWGALGGLLLASYVHLLGRAPERNWLLRTVEVRALFEFSPVLGYVAFVAAGVVLGWLSRRVEDRYVFRE